VVGPVLAALEGAPGPRLLDVGGGTGNYAVALRDAGFEPVVVDATAEMLERARSKGLETCLADAADLPFPDASVDAVTLISMLHHVAHRGQALREARRVLSPGGRLALVVYTLENTSVHWAFDYFPSTRAWIERVHPPLAEVVAELPGARVTPFEFHDLQDASVAALCRHPELVLDPFYRSQTSYFERLEAENPVELQEGLARLEADLAAGLRPDVERAALRARHGDCTLVAWSAPE
jgi:demethylmenaquinone methyltransferase/2-methoxy-6-polyprenyl-1,4-benzoquinol methylase